jgi:flavodoxin I
MIGYTSQDGYEHDDSKAIRGDKFCGLLCDEVNQDDLTEDRVQNWVAQLKAEGILDGSVGGADQVAPIEVVAEEMTMPPIVINGEKDLISELEAENARLRKLLEDSKIMDQVLKSDMMEERFIPHFNAKTSMTMWVSTDGRKAYYTKETIMSP